MQALSKDSQIKPLACIFGSYYFPQRYFLVIMVHLCLMNVYHTRIVYNIAIRDTIHREAEHNCTLQKDTCPQYQYEVSDAIVVFRDVFHWDSDWATTSLYAFYIGYAASHLPGGWLADKWGAKDLMGTCVALIAIITFAFPFVIIPLGKVGVVLIRAALGVVQGPLIPCIASFIQCWVPQKQRAFLGGVALSGAPLGAVTGGLLTGVMIDKTKNWAAPFYIWSLSCAVWLIIYLFTVFSKPKNHPNITEEELTYLDTEVERRVSFKVPWIAILKSKAFWALVSGQFGQNFIFFIFFTDFPKYLHEVQKLDISDHAKFSLFPFVLMWLSSLIFAFLSDYMVNNKWCERITVRRSYQAIANMAPPLFLLITGLAGCNREVSVWTYIVGLIFISPFYSSVKVNANDLTTHYSGTVTGMTSGLGVTASIISMSLIGRVTCTCSLDSWQVIFWIEFAVAAVSTVFYQVFASDERQTWDYAKNEVPVKRGTEDTA